MAEDGEDWNGLEITIWKMSLAICFFFSKYTNDDVAPLSASSYEQVGPKGFTLLIPKRLKC